MKTVSTQSKAERNYSLDKEALAALLAEAKKQKAFPNPYRGGAYKFSVDALASLGVNKWHTLASIIAQMKAANKEWFGAFKNKEARNDETGKDWEGRCLTNLQVLGRVKDYGLKLLQVGAVVDLRRGEKAIEARLNTASKEPMKLGRAATPTAKGKAATKAPTKAEPTKVSKGNGKPPILSGREAIAALKGKAATTAKASGTNRRKAA